MSQAIQKKSGESHSIVSHVSRALREGALFTAVALAIFLLISLVSYSAADPSWSHRIDVEKVRNAGGLVGAWFSDIALYVFGVFAYLFPIMVAYTGWLLFRGKASRPKLRQCAFRATGFVFTLSGGAGLAAMYFAYPGIALPLNTGGILGDVVGRGLIAVVNEGGATLFLIAMFLSGVSLFTGMSWFALMDGIGAVTLNGLGYARERLNVIKDAWIGRRARIAREKSVKVEQKKVEKRPPPRIEPVVQPVQVSERVVRERQVSLFDAPQDTSLPSLSLLDEAKSSGKAMSADALAAVSRLVEMKLKDFGVEVTVESVHPGPVVTRYELQPAAGVKSSQIANLTKDLARALSAISVRVVEVIPGKTTVGLEIPNEFREMVRLSEIVKSQQYADAKSPLTLALGKDISGQPTVTDLARMPHLLVAGTTGSGKSVAVNAMILSILYNATPKEVRLIMIDPKMLELSVYDGIPHLLAPVVTDMKEANNALRWCVMEMENRYRRMASLGVRNISSFNRKVEEAIANKQPIPDPLYKPVNPDDEVRTLTALPYIVVIVDELADMMMVVGKKVEEQIARLAQKARAAGIHLILATQRPSVDVLTGLIKANIPARIAFQVSARVDSRTILDQMGAEQLLGQGDMLYLPAGSAVPQRVHGAFVDDHEVHKVVADLKRKGQPQYIDEIINGPDLFGPDGGLDEGGAEADPLYDQAVRVVTESRRASVSGVQRRLKVGYNRAARMIEEMERAGVVGPMQSNGNREVLAPPPPSQ